MKYIIEHQAPQKCLYKRITGAYGIENINLMESMKKWALEKGLLESGTIYGIALDGLDTPAEKCRYDVCLVAENQNLEAEEGFLQGEIPGGCYAVFTVEHTQEAVHQFWASVMQIIPECGRDFDSSRPILERYKYSIVQQGKCEFCVPVI